MEVLNNLSFEVHENEFLVLLGPGRCGKTVLLNILANLEKQTSGTIEFAGGRPKMGDLGMVFQKYALFPWKTVMGNVEMSQKLKGVDKKVRQEKAQEYINLVGLKWKAFGWDVQSVDGHDIQQILYAIDNAKKEKGRPSMIILNTIKGKGVYFAENLVACHNMTITEEMWKKAVDMIDKEEI